mmetsp:Transcript_4932/g.22280  ORF Transcript_4932/g.22280 Transcript_4932/m.22280 type:complete len:255 (+) Transcript_4932:197-961(+)
MFDLCTNPETPTPTSTNAPNGTTFLTAPSTTSPTLRSASESAEVRSRLEASNASLSSTPGLANARRVSSSVSSPIPAADAIVLNSESATPLFRSESIAGRSRRRSSSRTFADVSGRFRFLVSVSASASMTMASSRVVPLRSSLRSTSLAASYPSGCTAVISSASFVESTRRKPAACWNVLTPTPFTSSKPRRDTNGPRVSLCVTTFSASDLLIPGTLASNAADAVLRLTPALATADSTAWSSSEASSLARTSCW